MCVSVCVCIFSSFEKIVIVSTNLGFMLNALYVSINSQQRLLPMVYFMLLLVVLVVVVAVSAVEPMYLHIHVFVLCYFDEVH